MDEQKMQMLFMDAMEKAMCINDMNFQYFTDKVYFKITQWNKHHKLIKHRYNVLKNRFNSEENITMLYIVMNIKTLWS